MILVLAGAALLMNKRLAFLAVLMVGAGIYIGPIYAFTTGP